MEISGRFIYISLFLILHLLRTDSRRFFKFPLKNCSTGDFDLLVVTDANSVPDCFDPGKTSSFVSQLIDLFMLPWEQSQPSRLRVTVALYSRLTSRVVVHFSSTFNSTLFQTNSSINADCSQTAQNQQPKPWTVFPIIDFIHKHFPQRSNTSENVTNLAITVLGGPNPGAVSEIDEVQNGQYNLANVKIFVIMVNFIEEVSRISLIPDTLHISTFSGLINNQLISLSICQKCSPGWFILEHQDSFNQISCYFLDIAAYQHDWFSGYSRCKKLRSKLASLETQLEIDFLDKKLSEVIKQVEFNDIFNVFIGLKAKPKSISKQLSWLSGNPLITSRLIGNRPNEGYILKCGIWIFEVPGTSEILNGTLDQVFSMYSVNYTSRWGNTGCGVRMSNASLCEFVIETSNRNDVISVETSDASLSSKKYAVEKGEFIEYEGAVVSIPANAGNEGFYNNLDPMYSGFELFNCQEGGSKDKLISYSYVCDHVQHCKNERDEGECFYLTCDHVREFQCRSRQCVPRESRCDAFIDCYDGSDEENCMQCKQKRSCTGKCIPGHWFNDDVDCNGCSDEVLSVNEAASEGPCSFICNRTSCVYSHQLGDGVVDCLGPEGQLDETIGKLEKADPCYSADEIWAPRCVYLKDRYGIILGCRDMSHLWNCQEFTCPDGYVKCPDSYCIPLHLLHDGERDCPLGEDEHEVKGQGCAGNFACFQSQVCLHLDLVCDGDAQCPAHDDELNCHITCADGFMCISGTVSIMGYDLSTPLLSLAFVDGRTRYLDLSGVDISGAIIDKDVTHLKNLVVIFMSNCKITKVNNIFSRGISNLQTVQNVDFSRNLITKISTDSAFRYMSNLRKLNLSYNEKLAVLDGGTFLTYYGDSLLEELDLSCTAISTLHYSVLQGLNNLKILNLSSTRIKHLYKFSFPKDFTLHLLDLRGSSIIGYDTNSFNGLSVKESLFTDNFGLCCPQIRGYRIPENRCHSPEDTISSCSHLVREQVQRVLFWFVGIMAVLGNVTVILCRILWDKGITRKAYGVFVTSLGISDLIMGVYLLIIAVADFYYREEYVLSGKIWKESTTCQIAGFLSTLSSETSALFTLLVTLDRFIVMKFPFGQWNFSKKTVLAASAIAWITGLILAAIPNLPQFSDWIVYSSNGMCLGLPLSTDKMAGWRYSVSVFVALNSAVFLVIVVGQFSIYRAMSENRVTVPALQKNNRRAQDVAVARQLSLVVLSNFLCWFPIGLMGLLALTGHEIGMSAYTWSAVLVMPINSALNPLLYTVPALQDKWKHYLTVYKAKRENSVKCKGIDSLKIYNIFFKPTE